MKVAKRSNNLKYKKER